MAYVKRNKYVFYCHIVVACCINGLERQINKLEKKRMVVPGIKKKKRKADFIRTMKTRSLAKHLDFQTNMVRMANRLLCLPSKKRG